MEGAFLDKMNDFMMIMLGFFIGVAFVKILEAYRGGSIAPW